MSIAKLLTEVDDKSLADCKIFLRIDSNYEDPLLKTLMLAARKDVMIQVGDKIDDFFDDNPIFQAAVLMKTYHMYVNRDSSAQAMNFDIKDGYASEINTMKDDYRILMDKQAQSNEESGE